MVVLSIFGFRKRSKEDMHTIGNEVISMERFADTITSLTKDGNMLKPFQSIFITVPRLIFVKVLLTMGLQKRLKNF